MNLKHVDTIAAELKIKPAQVAATAQLIAEGGTVPFIARYRKEATGMLDEVAITGIRDGMLRLAQLDERREAILKSLDERKLLTDSLKAKIEKAETMAVLEDLFAPFRPKRRTRATIAKEKGLEPLADWIEQNQENRAADPLVEAEKYIVAAVADAPAPLPDAAPTPATSVTEALAGARDIIAERISDAAEARAAVRKLIAEQAMVSSKIMFGKEEDKEAAKFRDYFDWSEPLKTIPSHRMLAIRRGEKEGFLMMRITPPEADALRTLEAQFVKGTAPCAKQMSEAVQDGYKRLLAPSMETEARLESKKKADAEAVRVFADNLRELLLAAPLGQKAMLGIDPGFRTGCKVVVLDAQGKLLFNDVIYLLGEGSSLMRAKELIVNLVQRFKIEAIAIGNGTAGRETEMFVNKIGLPKGIPVIMVNESGASIYSASEVAREEFPDQDITVRGAVSIGRRLMDPLAELVKIDPKSIGVGQYQHDVDQTLLKDSLDDVVMSSVNAVGVEVNTASKQLLAYVSGLNQSLAANIIAYRNEHGAFKTRAELRNVPRLGDKAFEQAAGFLRIQGATNPLDASAVHPERYDLVKRMAMDAGADLTELLTKEELRKKIELRKYVSEEVGLPTLQDIFSELAKPGRDPRKKFEIFNFQEGVEKMEHLTVGMKLPGIVTNVTAFGAFVDIGVHQDGLVHVSQCADHFVKDASEVLKVQQKVQVTVMEVDLDRKRIALSMRSKPDFEKRASGGGGSSGGGGGGSRPQPSGNQGGNRGFGGGGGQRSGGNSGGGGLGGGGDWFAAAVQKGKK